MMVFVNISIDFIIYSSNNFHSVSIVHNLDPFSKTI